MISAKDLRSGMMIRWNGELYRVISSQHVKMQQRAPIVRTKLFRLKGGSTVEQPFRAVEKFDDVYVERKELQYLYKDGDTYHFMDTEDYHDLVFKEDLIADHKEFLKENDTVTGLYCDNDLLSIELPPSVTLKITETEPGFRGDTAKGGLKPAIVETGATVRVPLFVTTGQTIRVDTRSGEYVERVS